MAVNVGKFQLAPIPPGLHSLPLAVCFVENTTDDTLPAYELFQLGGQIDLRETGTPVFRAEKFDKAFTPYIGSCGPADIPAGGFGPAFFGNLLPCKHAITEQAHHANGDFGIRSGGGWLSQCAPTTAGVKLLRVSVGDVLLRFTTLTSIPNNATISFPHPSDTDTWVGLVADPDLIYPDLSAGNQGWCIYKNGNYYAIQAPCGVA